MDNNITHVGQHDEDTGPEEPVARASTVHKVLCTHAGVRTPEWFINTIGVGLADSPSLGNGNGTEDTPSQDRSSHEAPGSVETYAFCVSYVTLASEEDIPESIPAPQKAGVNSKIHPQASPAMAPFHPQE